MIIKNVENFTFVVLQNTTGNLYKFDNNQGLYKNLKDLSKAKVFYG